MDRHKLAVTDLSMRMRNSGEIQEQRTESTTSFHNGQRDGYMSINDSDHQRDTQEGMPDHNEGPQREDQMLVEEGRPSAEEYEQEIRRLNDLLAERDNEIMYLKDTVKKLQTEK